MADHIREALAKSGLTNKKTGDSYGRITVSLGVAMYRPGESIDALVERADEALYRAKENGRNRVVGEEPDGAQPVEYTSGAQESAMN